MANMTFKANLLPDNTAAQRELGSSTAKWAINGVADPKLTDTLPTINTTGDGNAITAVSISGSTITVTKGSTFNNYTYTLPTASSSTKGGIKVGTGLSVSSDTLSVSTTSGTSTLAWNSEVTLGTVGGLAIKAKLPSNPNSNTWRPIQVNGAAALSDSTTTLNLKAGSNVSISNSSGTVTIAATDTTYSSLAAESGGTAVSLVTTGEKYTWNSKTSNTGTVTKVSTGVGLTGGDITGTGTVKAKLKTETAFTADSAAQTNTANRQYMVGVDKSGYLSVNVPWTDTTYSLSGLGGVGTVSASGTAPLTLNASKSGTTVSITGSIAAATTAAAGVTQYTAANLNTWLNQLTTGSSDPVDADWYISQYAGGGTTTTTFHRRPVSNLYNYIKTKLAVTNNNINLSRNTETTIATIGGTAIKIKLPASDNTDTKNTAGSTDTSSKIFLVGATSQTASAQTYSDNQVYVTNGQLDANVVQVATHVKLQYNTTTNALDFVFV